MGDKGFTARLEKGLFTFYIEQGPPSIHNKLSFGNTSNKFKQVTERIHHDSQQSLPLQPKEKEQGTEHSKIDNSELRYCLNERRLLDSIRGVKNKQQGQKVGDKKMRTNFVIKQNKTFQKYRHRQLSIKTVCSFIAVRSTNQYKLQPIVLNDIFRPKNQVFSKLKPIIREKYNMSTIAYRSLATDPGRLHKSSLKTQLNPNNSEEDRITPNANVTVFKKTQKKRRYFKNMNIAKLESSILQSGQNTERLQSQKQPKSKRYKSSMSYFEDRTNDLVTTSAFRAP